MGVCMGASGVVTLLFKPQKFGTLSMFLYIEVFILQMMGPMSKKCFQRSLIRELCPIFL